MRETTRVPAHPGPLIVVTGVGGLYIAQSVIAGITWTGLPAVMREQGLPLDHVGLTSLIALPWAFKFLWSPLVERYRLPSRGRNRSGDVVVTGGLVSIAGLLLVGTIGPSALLPALACLMVVAFAASTVDIACDGFAVERLAREHLGWGNTAQVGGAYIGSALGGGLFLVLVARYEWQLATVVMATLLVFLGLPFLRISRSHTHSETRAHTPSLRSALVRPEIRRGLLAAALYVAAQKSGLAMLGPFLIDNGLDLTTVGFLSGVGSMVFGFAAALLGGALVRVLGTRAVLIIAIAMQAMAFAFFAAISNSPDMPRSLLIAVAVLSSSGFLALGFVALYAQFMRWSSPAQAGIDFTLFQCMDALVSLLGGVLAGYAAQYFGYDALFAGAAVLAVLVMPMVSRVIDQH